MKMMRARIMMMKTIEAIKLNFPIITQRSHLKMEKKVIIIIQIQR